VRRLGDVALPGRFDEDEVDAALSRGDRQRAFSLLMTRYGEQVLRYAVAVTGDAEQAEEVRQQVFVEVYRDLPTFASRAPVRGWLFAIVRHRCLDTTKGLRRWSLRYKNERTPESEIDDTQPGDQIDVRRMAKMLEYCLAKLAPAAREAVLLRYQQELSYDEAAVVTGERPGTLQQRVARALPKLRQCVEAQMRAGGSS
jgi:RNA polymerase sigma-70 factor (ECF subfamily)